MGGRAAADALAAGAGVGLPALAARGRRGACVSVLVVGVFGPQAARGAGRALGGVAAEDLGEKEGQDDAAHGQAGADDGHVFFDDGPQRGGDVD